MFTVLMPLVLVVLSKRSMIYCSLSTLCLYDEQGLVHLVVHFTYRYFNPLGELLGGIWASIAMLEMSHFLYGAISTILRVGGTMGLCVEPAIACAMAIHVDGSRLVRWLPNLVSDSNDGLLINSICRRNKISFVTNGLFRVTWIRCSNTVF